MLADGKKRNNKGIFCIQWKCIQNPENPRKNVRIRSYSVRIQENTDQNNSEYGHFLRIATLKLLGLRIPLHEKCLCLSVCLSLSLCLYLSLSLSLSLSFSLSVSL